MRYSIEVKLSIGRWGDAAKEETTERGNQAGNTQPTPRTNKGTNEGTENTDGETNVK